MGNKDPLTALEPVKTLYTIFTILASLIKFPFLGIFYLIPAFRPQANWSYRLALSNEVVKSLFDFWSKTRASQPRVEKEGQGDQFVTIQPAPSDLHRGPLLQSSVTTAPVNGVWFYQDPSSTKAPGLSGGRTILHFHGGAFVFLSPQDSNVSDGLRALVSSIPDSALLAPEFRLASRPGCVFPAQLQDALSAYHYLLNDLGIPASRIVLSGDSAGANIVVGLLRYLQRYPVLPLPVASLLHSPWLNLSAEACVVQGNSSRRSDFVTSAFLQWGAESVTPDDMERDDEWISPFFHPFDCKVPLWVTDGTAEVLHADIVTWVERTREAGTRVEFYGAPGMVHNVIHVAKFMGLEEERTTSLLGAKAFLDSVSS